MILGDMAHVSVGVRDLDKAIEFYTQILGMTVTSRKQLPTGSVLVMVSPGSGSEIELTYNPNLSGQSLGSGFGLRHMAFWVRDLDAVVGQLKARGVEFYREPGPKGSSPRVAFFRDPDGADIELMQR